jgi:hypothetical protein
MGASDVRPMVAGAGQPLRSRSCRRVARSRRPSFNRRPSAAGSPTVGRPLLDAGSSVAGESCWLATLAVLVASAMVVIRWRAGGAADINELCAEVNAQFGDELSRGDEFGSEDDLDILRERIDCEEASPR